ncbi:hypothetical protein VP01_1095g2 [Puccinia sorghi]|uniref:Uncharacterized protein n=1 Tax=Puccinia sorghi TaxID=27349 RepID=A0A0L6VUF6_9BASI|nr:hypothetical protein VP01_1095g2 [Puccinia sorghi]
MLRLLASSINIKYMEMRHHKHEGVIILLDQLRKKSRKKKQFHEIRGLKWHTSYYTSNPHSSCIWWRVNPNLKCERCQKSISNSSKLGLSSLHSARIPWLKSLASTEYTSCQMPLISEKIDFQSKTSKLPRITKRSSHQMGIQVGFSGSHDWGRISFFEKKDTYRVLLINCRSSSLYILMTVLKMCLKALHAVAFPRCIHHSSWLHICKQVVRHSGSCSLEGLGATVTEGLALISKVVQAYRRRDPPWRPHNAGVGCAFKKHRCGWVAGRVIHDLTRLHLKTHRRKTTSRPTAGGEPAGGSGSGNGAGTGADGWQHRRRIWCCYPPAVPPSPSPLVALPPIPALVGHGSRTSTRDPLLRRRTPRRREDARVGAVGVVSLISDLCGTTVVMVVRRVITCFMTSLAVSSSRISAHQLNTFITTSIYTFQSIRLQLSSPTTAQYVIDSSRHRFHLRVSFKPCARTNHECPRQSSSGIFMRKVSSHATVHGQVFDGQSAHCFP